MAEPVYIARGEYGGEGLIAWQWTNIVGIFFRFLSGMRGFDKASAMLAPALTIDPVTVAVVPPYDLMQELRKYGKIDSYATSNLSDDNLRTQIHFADRLGIEKLFIAMPMTEIKIRRMNSPS